MKNSVIISTVLSDGPRPPAAEAITGNNNNAAQQFNWKVPNFLKEDILSTLD